MNAVSIPWSIPESEKTNLKSEISDFKLLQDVIAPRAFEANARQKKRKAQPPG